MAILLGLSAAPGSGDEAGIEDGVGEIDIALIRSRVARRKFLSRTV